MKSRILTLRSASCFVTRASLSCIIANRRSMSRSARLPYPAAMSHAAGPTVTTERLTLRRWRDEDREPFAALNADPVVMRFFPSPLTREQSDRLVERFEARIADDGIGQWAVERREDGRFLGFTGLASADFEAAFTPAVEVG